MLGEHTDDIMGDLISTRSIAYNDDNLGHLNRCGMCIADHNQNILQFSSEIKKRIYYCAFQKF